MVTYWPDDVEFWLKLRRRMDSTFPAALCHRSSPANSRNKYLFYLLLASKIINKIITRMMSHIIWLIYESYNMTYMSHNMTLSYPTLAIWTNFPSACNCSTAFLALSVLSKNGLKSIFMYVTYSMSINCIQYYSYCMIHTMKLWAHDKVDESISFAFVGLIINNCLCRYNFSEFFTHFLKIKVCCLEL